MTSHPRHETRDPTSPALPAGFAPLAGNLARAAERRVVRPLTALERGVLCLLLFTLLPLFALAAELPTPPEGFEWHPVGKFKCSVLRPKGWVVSTEDADAAFTVMVRPPEWQKNPNRGAFMLTIIPGPLRNLTVDEYLRDWEKGMALGLLALKTWPTEIWPFVGKAGLFRWRSESEDPAQSLAAMTVNKKTGTAYLSMFVATVSNWATDWKLGKPMVTMIAFDDDY